MENAHIVKSFDQDLAQIESMILEMGGMVENQIMLSIDALISRASELMGKAGYVVFFGAALDSILTDIHDDLHGFGVDFDEWFSEVQLEKSGAIAHAI